MFVRAARALLIVVACAAVGCAHASAPAPPEPQRPAAEPFNPTEMMIALEDVRGLYLPKRPRLAQLDDVAFADACMQMQRATSWHAGDDETWRTSGRAAAAEVTFRNLCQLTTAFYERSGDRVVIKRDTFARMPRGKQVELLVHELVHAIQAHALPQPPAEMS